MLRRAAVSCVFEVGRHDVGGPQGLDREEWGTTRGEVFYSRKCVDRIGARVKSGGLEVRWTVRGCEQAERAR